MQSNRPLYIFDLDGTLALIEHRRHFVESTETCKECKGSKADPVTSSGGNFHPCVVCNGKGFTKVAPNWSAFYEACHMDMPNAPVIKTFVQLYTVGAELKIWSGREDSVRQKTLLWLSRHTGVAMFALEQMLLMRPAGDFTPDEQLKRKWLNQLDKSQRARLTAVFDDRDKVVAMWRKAGVSCFQVAPGEF